MLSIQLSVICCCSGFDLDDDKIQLFISIRTFSSAAHALCLHVDQKQLLYAIKSEYMSGPLRLGFYDLLIALHLESHATTM